LDGALWKSNTESQLPPGEPVSVSDQITVHIIFAFEANGPGICQYNLRQWIQQLSGTLTPEKKLELSKSNESGMVKKSQDSITGATKVSGAQTNLN